MTYQSINPYTRQVMNTYETITDRELDDKLKTAELGFNKWSQTRFSERAQLMKNVPGYAGITQRMGKDTCSR